MIRRAIIAVTALALVVAMAVPALAQDDVNTATSAPVGQTGTISQTAQQCVEADEGSNYCAIIDKDDDNGNGDDNGKVIVAQANVDNTQNATAVGGVGGDNVQEVEAEVEDDNGNDNGDDNGGDNVAAVGQQMQCQNATASNQIENDASVQVDTILSNSNAGDVENIGNVCQNSAAVAQQQNDDED